MLERGDLQTFHEPFIYLYYVHDARKKLDYFDADPRHPTSYEDIKRMILDAAQTRPVFVKDMCYYVAQYIHGDRAFIESIKSTFLIRDPRKTIASYYRLDPALTCDEVGLEAQYRQFALTAEVTGEVPMVIDADDLVADTEGVMRAYCETLALPFVPDALNWSGELPDEWRFVQGWHRDLQGSAAITARPKQGIDIDAVPKLKSLYEHHLPYYEKLYTHRIRIGRR